MPNKADRADVVISLLRSGYTLTDAAKKARVAPSTVAMWRRRGKKDYDNRLNTWHALFWRESEDARYYACSLIENSLYADALESPAAALKWLEAFAPDSYADAVEDIRLEHTSALLERLNNEPRAATSTLQ